MLCNSYNSKILYEEFHGIYLRGDIKLLLVTVNNRLTLEIETGAVLALARWGDKGGHNSSWRGRGATICS